MQITINTLDNGVTVSFTPKDKTNTTPMPHMMQPGQGTKNIYVADADLGKTLTEIITDFRK